jgi:hypothetical protein
LITGNDARAEEFFERARKALEDLLEVNDYAVAEALFALGYYLYGRVPHPPLSTLARSLALFPNRRLTHLLGCVSCHGIDRVV